MMQPGMQDAYRRWVEALQIDQCYICQAPIRKVEMYRHYCDCCQKHPREYNKVKLSWSIVWDTDFDVWMSVNYLGLRENEAVMPKTFEERLTFDDRKLLDGMRIGLGDVKPLTPTRVQTDKPCALTDMRGITLNESLFEQGPCYLCDYAGEGYFMPVYHACAFNYHGALRTGEMKPGEVLYVVAGSYEEAAQTCDELRLSRTTWRYVSTAATIDRSQVNDHHPARVLLTGTYWQRVDWPSLNFLLTEMLHARVARHRIVR